MPKSKFLPQSTDWKHKEAREMFCRAVNSMLMTNPKTPLDEVLATSKKIIDTAFKNYPDRAEEDAKAQNFELDIIEQ